MKKYLNYLRKSGREPTAKTYGSVLKTFSWWIKKRGRTLKTATTADIEEYMRSRKSPNTAQMFLTAIRQYHKFLMTEIPPTNIEQAIAANLKKEQLLNIKPPRKKEKLEKISLNVEELRLLLEQVASTKDGQLLLSGTVLTFYFGWRPKEAHEHIKKARIDWENRTMIIETAKREGSMRFLAWHPNITPYLLLWSSALPPHNEWLTKRLKKFEFDGMVVTAKTGRKTFETQMKLHGIDQYMIDVILGHKSKISPIGDIYTDRTQFVRPIHEVMENKHYMIVEKVI
jgi:site-specific recombinase XerD